AVRRETEERRVRARSARVEHGCESRAMGACRREGANRARSARKLPILEPLAERAGSGRARVWKSNDAVRADAKARTAREARASDRSWTRSRSERVQVGHGHGSRTTGARGCESANRARSARK